jgi:large subunit ribosomal protein L22
MEAKAIAKYVPISAQKVRLIADLVRNQPVQSALSVLSFTPKRGSNAVGKVLKSAIANASQNSNVDSDNLYVKRIYVDESYTRKWIQPRARGMAYRIRRRRCHITVIVDEKGEGNVG